MFVLFISSKTPSSQRVLGLPIGLLVMGFHFLIFCTILYSAMRSTWPSHFNLFFSDKPDLCYLSTPFLVQPLLQSTLAVDLPWRTSVVARTELSNRAESFSSKPHQNFLQCAFTNDHPAVDHPLPDYHKIFHSIKSHVRNLHTIPDLPNIL